jgi:hypothetical protein
MDQRESDPTGAFRGGSAGLEDDAKTELERHAPGAARSDKPDDDDETEREVVTSGIASTSEVADPEAQANAERQGDGTPQPH